MIEIVENTDRVSRMTPKKVMITNVVDIHLVRSEESLDKLYQLVHVHTNKLDVDMYLYKCPSNSGKPHVVVIYKGVDSGIIFYKSETIDLMKPRSITDLVEESVTNLVQNKLVNSPTSVPGLDKLLKSGKLIYLNDLV